MTGFPAATQQPENIDFLETDVSGIVDSLFDDLGLEEKTIFQTIDGIGEVKIHGLAEPAPEPVKPVPPAPKVPTQLQETLRIPRLPPADIPSVQDALAFSDSTCSLREGHEALEILHPRRLPSRTSVLAFTMMTIALGQLALVMGWI